MNFSQKLSLFVAIGLITGSGFFHMQSALAGQSAGSIAVANRASGDISVIDVATDTAFNVAMPAGTETPEPMYVVSTLQRVFVGDRANDQVVVFDPDDWSLIGEIPAGNGIFHMWAQPKGKQLWVVNDIDKTITVIDTLDLQVITTIDLPADLTAGGRPHDVILDKRAAFITMIGFSSGPNVLLKYDLEDFVEQNRVDIGSGAHLTLRPNGNALFVADEGGNQISELKKRDLSLLNLFDVDAAHGVDISRNGRYVYATNISGGGIEALYTLNTRTNTLVGDPVDTPFPVPHNIVLTGDNSKLYVTHSGATADKVSVYTVSTQQPEPEFVTDITVGSNPFGLDFVE